ncbi:glycosyltransferase [Streptomyces sp. NPDC051597]|uniref:glycosyltransferase n=1 Tax=Streptomyces sp. NPDC051597 TaxID=3155049 RepID=UPI0034240D85
MRVLLVAYGSRGDVEPMLALGAALRACGVQVQVCAPPEFVEPREGGGTPVVAFGQSLRAMAADVVTRTAGDRQAQGLSGCVAGMVAATYDSVAVATAMDGCDVVVAAGPIPVAAAARAVAEKLGVPYVFATYSPAHLPWPRHRPLAWPGWPLPPEATDDRVLWDLNGERVNALFGEGINTQRAAIGLPPVDDVRDHVLTGRPLLAADATLSPGPRPAGLDVVQTGAWIRPDNRPLPTDVDAFLKAGTPPVYVDFGTMPARDGDARGTARAAVQAIRAQGRRVVIGRGWPDLAVTDGQGDCFAVDEANLQALFTRSAVVVHQGDAGTTTTAALAGVPQVVVPQTADQAYWASRVADLGIGAAHDGPRLTYASLSVALRTVLNPGTRARADAMAVAIRTDGATVAGRLLREMVGRGRPLVAA